MTSGTPDAAVPDTSCLIALNAASQLDLLSRFYAEVLIPPAVAQEYGGELPSWIQTRKPGDPGMLGILRESLGSGESESIALACELPGSLLILDDLRPDEQPGAWGSGSAERSVSSCERSAPGCSHPWRRR